MNGILRLVVLSAVYVSCATISARAQPARAPSNRLTLPLAISWGIDQLSIIQAEVLPGCPVVFGAVRPGVAIKTIRRVARARYRSTKRRYRNRFVRRARGAHPGLFFFQQSQRVLVKLRSRAKNARSRCLKALDTAQNTNPRLATKWQTLRKSTQMFFKLLERAYAMRWNWRQASVSLSLRVHESSRVRRTGLFLLDSRHLFASGPRGKGDLVVKAAPFWLKVQSTLRRRGLLVSKTAAVHRRRRARPKPLGPLCSGSFQVGQAMAFMSAKGLAQTKVLAFEKRPDGTPTGWLHMAPVNGPASMATPALLIAPSGCIAGLRIKRRLNRVGGLWKSTEVVASVSLLRELRRALRVEEQKRVAAEFAQLGKTFKRLSPMLARSLVDIRVRRRKASSASALSRINPPLLVRIDPPG
jgi:hypothetical protein